MIIPSTLLEFNIYHWMARLWANRNRILFYGLVGASCAFILSFFVGNNFSYESIMRIEPEISTAGESTNIDTEEDVLKSWATTAATVESMDRYVMVASTQSRKVIRLKNMLEGFYYTVTGIKAPQNAGLMPAPKVDRFHISGSEGTYLGKKLLLKIIDENSYALYDPGGNPLMQGEFGKLETVHLDNAGNDLTVQITPGTAMPNQSFLLIPLSKEGCINNLLGRLKIKRLGFRNSNGLLAISFDDPDPVFAEQYLNALVDDYILQAFDHSSRGKMKALTNLEEESETLKQKTGDAERAFEEFQADNQTIDLPHKAGSIAEHSVMLEEEIQKQTNIYEKMGAAFTPEHPSMQVVEKQLIALKKKLAETNEEIAALPEKQRQLLELQRNMDIQNRMLSVNTTSIATLRAEVASITGYARKLSPAIKSSQSAMTKAFVFIVLGFIAGSLPVFMVVSYQAIPIFTRIMRREDIDLTLLPVIAVLPTKKPDASALIISQMERDVGFLVHDTHKKVLLFTALDHKQGISFCAQQFAQASASSHRTLLVDATIMAPLLHEYYRLPPSQGLSDILSGQAQALEVVQPTDIPNLFFLSAGTQTANYRLLLDYETMQKALGTLSEKFDRIIVRFPPLTEALCQKNVVNFADVVFVVIRKGMYLKRLQTLWRTMLSEHKSAFIIFNGGK